MDVGEATRLYQAAQAEANGEDVDDPEGMERVLAQAEQAMIDAWLAHETERGMAALEAALAQA